MKAARDGNGSRFSSSLQRSVAALQGKVVLITGASSGLGAATARSCAAAGCRVALAARRVDRLQQLAAEIDQPGDTLILPADLRDPESILQMVSCAEEHFGQIDALVANAGVGLSVPLAETDDERLMHQVDVNVLGVVRSARAVLPGMLARGSGHVLTVASVAAEIPSANAVVYGMTKGAVLAFSEGLYREVRRSGVHVTCILPGFVRSEMTADVPLRMPEASIVGDLVVDLLRRPRRRAVVPRFYGAAIWLNRLFPGIVDRLADVARQDFERRRGG